ncbi:hypothetical protein VNO80_23774 [Phaseolus coccineus]|uniref:Uncharacterized protein n=1 Tax=Phaseolus coccineus TaxID=3886 RepID=A0AAN9MBU1_PHACN
MSAMVEVWKWELTKLREKVMACKNLLSKGKEVAGDEHAEKNEVLQKGIMAVHRDTTMSEATVCLLLDRFVPC